MKKLMVLAMVFTVSVSFVMANGDQEKAGKEGSKPIELSFAGFMPPTSPWEQRVMAPLIEEIEKQTNGKVKIIEYQGGTLLEGGKVYDGVAIGAADMGHESLSWVNGRFLVSDLLKKSGVPFHSGEAASRTFTEMVEILDPTEFHDVKLLMAICTGPGNIHSIKPIHTLEDLQGLQIRCIGSDAPSLTALGAKPIAMSHQEGYEALQKGIIQGTLASNESLHVWHTEELTDYTTLTPFMYNGLQAVMMNLATWNSLPADLQEGIVRACDKIYEEVVVHFYDEEGDNGMAYAIEHYDHQVIELSEEETARWKSKIAHILDHYAEELDSQGLPGSEARRLIFELGDKYNRLHNEYMKKQNN